MVYENIFESYGFANIRAYSGKDISEEMIDECLQIDKIFYNEEYYLDGNELNKTIARFGQFCFIFYDISKKKVFGYSFWFPVKTAVLKEFMINKQMILNIKEEYCESIQGSDVINLFSGGQAFCSGYDLNNLHKAVEDLFQKKVLDLAYKNKKINYIAIEACCKYDETYLVPLLNLKNKMAKPSSVFYYDHYSPMKIYSRSKYVTELKKFYN